MDHFLKIVVLPYRDYVNAIKRVLNGTKSFFFSYCEILLYVLGLGRVRQEYFGHLIWCSDLTTGYSTHCEITCGKGKLLYKNRIYLGF